MISFRSYWTISTIEFNEMLFSAIEEVQFISPTSIIVNTGHIDLPVTGDKERLKQVVVNLLTNAIKYSPDSDKVYMYSVRKGTSIIISVKDTGIGILKEILKKYLNCISGKKGGPYISMI